MKNMPQWKGRHCRPVPEDFAIHAKQEGITKLLKR